MGAPREEIRDAVMLGDVLWVAAASLYRYEDGSWHEVISGGRFSALAYQRSSERLWFARSDGLGYLTLADGTIHHVIGDTGFIWDLVYREGKIWYVTAGGYGWVDPETEEIGEHWRVEFAPRPQLILADGAGGRMFVSSGSGFWEIGVNGPQLQISRGAVHERVILWAVKRDLQYYIGTNREVFIWSGEAGDEPRAVESDYGRYFSRGINNAVRFGSDVAIVDHPGGVVVWNTESERVTGYIGAEGGLDVGDVHIVARGSENTLLVLGTSGMASIRMDRLTRFFPSESLWGTESVGSAFFHRDSAVVVSEKHWFYLGEAGFVRKQLEGNVGWAGVDLTGSVAFGFLNSYKRWSGESPLDFRLDAMLSTAHFSPEGGFATGPAGFYSFSREPALQLLVPTRAEYHLLGNSGPTVFAYDYENRLARLEMRGSGWRKERMDALLPGRPVSSASVGDYVAAVSEGGLYRIRAEGVERVPIGEGWTPSGVAAQGRTMYAILTHSERGTAALAAWYGDGHAVMVEAPEIGLIGTPIGVIASETKIGLVGAAGVLLEGRDSWKSVSTPALFARLTHEGDPVGRKRLPYGAQRIVLETATENGDIPTDLAYRIGGGEWQVTTSGNQYLPIGGHGRFDVDVRPVFPNGVAGPIRTLELAIAPPWYLNPFAQGGILMLMVALIWSGFYLRHLNIQRTNRWLRDEVKRQTRELEAATAARTNFLAGISHDIRNPLNGILLISESLSSDPPASLNDPRLDEIRDLGIVVDQMLGEVLDFSVIDRASIVLSPGPVRAAEIVESAVHQNKWAIERSLINVTVRIPENVQALSINADRSWLIQALSNLISNALSYSGTERIEVGATLIDEGTATAVIAFAVKDWGIGIPESEKFLIFERFYRGEAGVESGRHGTGLGLSICHDAVRAMGGEVVVQDNEPEGAVFVITCRFEKAEGGREIDREGILASLRGKSVLIVEDLDYNRHAMVQFFERWGCDVVASAHGGEALELLRTKPFHLAMIDWDLPGLSGPQITRRFRRENPDSDAILIALTAYTDADKKRESRDAGMDAYLAKPLTAQRLAYALAGIQGHWTKPVHRPADRIDTGRITRAIEEHVAALMKAGEEMDLDNIRRTAHRLTTLALISGDRDLQRVCRELQDHARGGETDDIREILRGVRKWMQS